MLRALADEFDTQLGVPELRALMSRIGARFARAKPLGPCATLDDVELALNRVWAALDWGWAEIADLSEHLSVRHFCAPLEGAFGANGAVWASAFLEGVYQRWFADLGAGDQLALRQVEPPPAIDVGGVAKTYYEFQLAR
ncbi:cellulose synthase [Pararobbsia silviterrae]|uniref:Cellulose synthase n=2 Tax=Pararobbsia silviterrae TaxID=1792498 RepID=A0A494XBB2_9BURK|nr:cellulose synthase [Pararobbsia silviterrae]